MAISKITSNSIQAGSLSTSVLDSTNAGGTGAVTLPIGTTAQRPSSPTTGMTRYNTTTNSLELWNGASWVGFGLIDGLSSGTAAPSALYLKTVNPSITSGLYWIKPSGMTSAYQVYCDMTYDGGGWQLAFAYATSQTPVANVSNYYQSPQDASTSTGSTVAAIANPNNPAQSFCMPAAFWTSFGSDQQGRGEIREEYAISGGTWPNNSNRVVTFHGGRTSGGAAGNFLTSTQMGNARTVMGYNGRATFNYGSDVGSTSRSGYLNNTLDIPSRYGSAGNTNTYLGISNDASNLGTAGTTDGTNNYTNQTPATSFSWIGRGSGHSDAGSSQNGTGPNGTRWALVWIR